MIPGGLRLGSINVFSGILLWLLAPIALPLILGSIIDHNNQQ